MSKDLYNMKDLNFEAKFTMDEEGLRGLAKFLKELDDEIVDDIFSGKQGLNIRDSKRGEVELSRVVRCKDCKWFTAVNEACGKCTYRTRAFLYNENDDYCSYGERREQEHE